jgi:glycosyltransferase involved in cell wall biosynthesis
MRPRWFGKPTFSLIVPTRQRPDQLRRFLDSLAAATACPRRVEVILVIDEDDPASRAVTQRELIVRHVIVPPGLTMGRLNTSGYQAARGAFLMLLNDDVVARTRGWDQQIRTALDPFVDRVVLVHTNDLLFRDLFCTFPLVSRTYCDLAGGICPPEFIRYRIDDYIFDVFHQLESMGEPRRVYLPEVVFEHFNYREQENGRREYNLDERFVVFDAPRYDALRAERHAIALRLREHIHRLRRHPLERVRACYSHRGLGGLVRTGWRRLVRWGSRLYGAAPLNPVQQAPRRP